MSVKRRRAKADRNRKAFPVTSANMDNDWVKSGRIACSYGSHDGNPCSRCGAEYLTEIRTIGRIEPITVHKDDMIDLRSYIRGELVKGMAEDMARNWERGTNASGTVPPPDESSRGAR